MALYATTDRTALDIARECGVTVSGLLAYLRRHHRVLILGRYGIQTDGVDPQSIKIQPAKGMRESTYLKYREAVDACRSMEYIEMNISQIAREFHLDGTALGNILKAHYPEIPVWREKVRWRLGVNDNTRRGSLCTEQYAEAVRIYGTTDLTLPEVAEACHVSEGGLSQHLRFYHQDLLTEKEARRKRPGKRVRGELAHNGRRHEPNPETVERYARALDLYRDTSMRMKDIVRETGVSAEGFRAYLHKWHKELVVERLGIAGELEEGMDLRSVRRRMKTVSAKYEQAIRSLRTDPRPVSAVAAAFGLHPETFRKYLRKHEPELAKRFGRDHKRLQKEVANHKTE